MDYHFFNPGLYNSFQNHSVAIRLQLKALFEEYGEIKVPLVDGFQRTLYFRRAVQILTNHSDSNTLYGKYTCSGGNNNSGNRHQNRSYVIN